MEVKPDLKEELEKNFVETLRKYGGSPLQTDEWIYRIVVISLGAAVLLCLIFAFMLAMDDQKDTPQILIAIGSAAVGALAGLLAPSPKRE
ncbi:MAG: hypothetical protein ISS16_07080 [Ignavibacteria bacterium]|nr:hypothetical protein [Ignavibacteria bacterium]